MVIFCGNVVLQGPGLAQLRQLTAPEQGWRLDPASTPPAPPPAGTVGVTPICLAAGLNASASVMKLLLPHADVCAAVAHGCLPLHYAAQSNQSVDVVRLLLEAGGSEQLTRQNDEGFLPMHLAMRSNPASEVIRELIDAGGAAQLRVPESSGRTPLHYCCASNSSVEVLSTLLSTLQLEALRARA
jgi:ankyrin repeat protein